MDRRRGPEHSVPHGMGREDCACSKRHRVRFIGILKGIFSKGKKRHAVGPDGGRMAVRLKQEYVRTEQDRCKAGQGSGKERMRRRPDGGSGKERMCRMVWGVA